MRISKIILDNFRGYSHAEIDFNRFNCIVGKNDVGKSTIFVALDWFFGNRNLSDNDINIANIVKDDDGFIVSGDELYVEVYFEVKYDTEVPDFLTTDDNHHFFRRDILSDNILRIKKFYIHSSSYQFESGHYVQKKGYQVWTKKIKNLGNRPLSFLTTDELKYEGSKIGKEFEKIKSIIDTEIERQKPKSPDDVAAQVMFQLDKDLTDNKTFERICVELSTFYSANSVWEWKNIDSDVMDFILQSSSFIKFQYFNAETPLKDSIQVWFSAQDTRKIQLEVDQLKDELAQLISKNFFYNGQSESFDISKSYDFVANSVLLSNKGIPLSKRGDGFQLKIKNTIFSLLTPSKYSIQQPVILVFEEPETHQHPSAQIEMYNSISALSDGFQVFITTHSPTIVSCCNINNIIQIKKVNGNPKVYQNKTITLQEVIEDLGIGPNDAMLSIFDEYKSILFVEGKNDIYTLNKISELYKNNHIVEQTFNEMKCLIIPVGGCSTVEEWANFGIVTKLSKPFAVLLDSDKKAEGDNSSNQTKLNRIFDALNSSIDENKKIKMKLCKQNFMLTRKREMENYIKPCVIEKYYNIKKCNKDEKWKYEDIDEILAEFKDCIFVTFSIVKYVYDNEHKVFKPSLDPIIQEELKDITNNEEKKDRIYQIHKKHSVKNNVIEKLKQYINDYTEFHPKKFDTKFEEWIYCKEKGINIDDYDKYADIIGVRSFVFCLEKRIAIAAYEDLYSQCRWIGTDYYYLITYLLNKKNIKFEISSFSTKEQFENSLDDELKGKMKTIKEEISKTTIPDEYTEIHFGDDIDWRYIDVPRAIYYQKKRKDYNENDDDIKQDCEVIKKDINKYFFEEGNIKFEDLDFSYGEKQDEFLDIYSIIKALSE